MTTQHGKAMFIRRYAKFLLTFAFVGTLVTLLLYSSPKTINFVPGKRITLDILSSSKGFYESKVESKIGEKWEEIQCKPHSHVMFLKTHKCASSTVQNVFLRYGFRNNLTFALPAELNSLGFPNLFKVEMLPKNLVPTGGKVDIFAVHTRLNPPELQKVLHDDTRWVTVIRDPPLQYESLFHFTKLDEFYKMNLSQYSKEPLEKLMALPRKQGKFGKNQMLFDLGYPEDLQVRELRSAIDLLDKQFDLVMISEFMDESLILLRHILCWSLHDLVYFTKNARREEVKTDLEPEVKSILRELNSADAILYDHFLAKHKRAVLEFGQERMANEVSALQDLRETYYENCGTREVEVYSGLVNAYISSNSSDQNCRLLTLPELPLLNVVRRHQKTRLTKTRPRT